jgi:ParB family chromosome partitioning protein
MSKAAGPRLGRGLAALMGDMTPPPAEPVAQPGSSQGARTLPIELLTPGPFQPRTEMNPDALAELVESIRQRGVLQPMLVRPDPAGGGRFQIIAGERRWRAAQQAGLHEVPVFVRELSDTDAMAAALVENLQRQDLNALEEAEGYRRLIDEFHLTQEQLGAAVGKSRSHVANAIRLMQLPASVQAEIRKGTLSAGHARALLAHPDPAKAALVVIARDLSVRQTEALAKQATAPQQERERRSADPETEALQRELSEKLGLRVEIAFNGKAGHVKIHYKSLDQLDGLLALLNRD